MRVWAGGGWRFLARMTERSPDAPPPVTPARVLVTVLIALAMGLLMFLYFVPLSSPWFWPTAGALGVVGLAAWLVPLKDGRGAGARGGPGHDHRGDGRGGAA